jgi:hypothetical protein
MTMQFLLLQIQEDKRSDQACSRLKKKGHKVVFGLTASKDTMLEE